MASVLSIEEIVILPFTEFAGCLDSGRRSVIAIVVTTDQSVPLCQTVFVLPNYELIVATANF